jgi:hypothetical protein
MVGGDYAGMMVRDSKKALSFGNIDITQASVLLVFRKD